MDLAEAFQIVLDLAKQNALTIKDVTDFNLITEHDRQHEALTIVEDFIVNQLGDS